MLLLIGFVVGIAGGMIADATDPSSPWVSRGMMYIVWPIEQIFLGILLALIFPLLISAIVSGIVHLRDEKSLRRLLLTTLGYMLAFSMIASLLGLAMGNLFRPGDGVAPDIAQRLLLTGREGGVSHSAFGALRFSVLSLFLANPPGPAGTESQSSFPRVIGSALLLGFGLAFVRTRFSAPIARIAQKIFETGTRVVRFVSLFAPLAVACFMFDLTVQFGWHLLGYLSTYVIVVVAALMIQMGVVFSGMVWIMVGQSPPRFLKSVQEVALMAFSTSSSNATLPTSLKVALEGLHLDSKVARLVMGVGTIADQCGTAIYINITVIFVGQFFGMDLSIGQQALVFALTILAGMGTVGVPAGSLPTVAAILALLGLPPEGIGLIIGVDRLLDMFRTTINVLGDMAILMIVSRVSVDPIKVAAEHRDQPDDRGSRALTATSEVPGADAQARDPTIFGSGKAKHNTAASGRSRPIP